jgi:hypothetical protein
MRALILLALLPAVARAEELEVTVTGDLYPTLPITYNPPTSTWNGPGPFPTSFGMTFLVNTLAPGNTLTNTVFDPNTGFLQAMDISVSATDFTITLNGKTIESDGTGYFAISGSGLGPCSFIGGEYTAGSTKASFFGVPDFSLAGGGCVTQSELLNSKDPIGLLLNNSGYFPDDGWNNSYLIIDNSRLISTVNVGIKSVPEPATFGLMALGFAWVGLARRRRRR